jgi:Uncharacterized protein conserved in bacteria (DUF2252)
MRAKQKKKEKDVHEYHKQSAIKADYLSKPSHLHTRKDRYEAGRALREKCPREAHAEYKVDWRGREDPIKLLIRSSKGRIERLLPIRYGRMQVTPFTFLRGAAVIMAADLAETPTTGYAVQSCGDCHVLNFGAFATPERNVIFDINDFDETFPAPWEWDLKRLAASFAVASRNNGHKRSDGIAAATRMAQCYRDRLFELSEMRTLDSWYSFLDYKEIFDTMTDRRLRKIRKENLAKALSRDARDEFIKLGHVVGSVPRIKDQPPLIYHEEGAGTPEYKKRQLRSVELYRESLSIERRVLFDRYELVDNAIKVVGIGSVGTTCAIGLFYAAEGDPLFLQVKEARASVLEPYSQFDNHETNGARVVHGQRIMQAASDLFLGHYVSETNRHFYVRQLRDVKVKPLVEMYSPGNMLGFATICGWALARAHSRSGDPTILAGYIGKGNAFPKAIGAFANTYMEQNEADHERLKEAIKNGVVEAEIELD